MKLTVHEPTGLVVPVQSMDEQAVQRELQKRDRMLFLDKEITYSNQLLYSVKFYVPDHAPLDLFSWTDEYGNPLPLSSALIDKLDSLDRNYGAALASERVREATRKREEAWELEADAEYEDIARGVGKRIGKTRSHVRKVSVPERARRNEHERRRRLRGKRR
jgi:hypothetical protein